MKRPPFGGRFAREEGRNQVDVMFSIKPATESE